MKIQDKEKLESVSFNQDGGMLHYISCFCSLSLFHDPEVFTVCLPC